MAEAAEGIHQRRFTVEEYHRMGASGIFKRDERVELIRGVVRQMSPRNIAHVVATTRLYQRLVKALEARASVFQESPLKLESLDAEPEPDILVMSSPMLEDYGTERSRPLLVVEVSEASLRYDLNPKSPLYAEAGVPEYWVVNLIERELLVFRSPLTGVYQDRHTYRPSDRVAPEAWPDVVLEVESLFSS